MSKDSFDIESLSRFSPPRYFCKKCFGIFTQSFDVMTKKEVKCPVCKVEYIPTEEFETWQCGRYLDREGLGIKFDNLIAHCQKLAVITNLTKRHLKIRKKGPFDYPPLRALFESLLAAQKFVHFSSYGISMMLFGALKLIAQRIDIRGIVANVKSDQIQELTKYRYEAPKMKLLIFKRGIEHEKKVLVPHQKFIIIDGLMAFKGTSNLTLEGWRKSAEGREIFELVTHVEEVIELNNSYFSPVWAESSDIEKIRMEEEVPF